MNTFYSGNAHKCSHISLPDSPLAHNKHLTMTDRSKPTQEKPRYVFFFTGPTASGKSTVAKYVANNMNFFFLEGDDVSSNSPYSNKHTQLLLDIISRVVNATYSI